MLNVSGGYGREQGRRPGPGACEGGRRASMSYEHQSPAGGVREAMGASTETRRRSALVSRHRARCRSPKRRTTLQGRSQDALSALDALMLRGTRTSGFPKCLAAATRMCTPTKHTRQNERSVRWRPGEGGLLGARGHGRWLPRNYHNTHQHLYHPPPIPPPATSRCTGAGHHAHFTTTSPGLECRRGHCRAQQAVGGAGHVAIAWRHCPSVHVVQRTSQKCPVSLPCSQAPAPAPPSTQVATGAGGVSAW